MPSVRADLVRHPRLPGAVVALTGVATFVVLAWWLVPWDFALAPAVDPGMAANFFVPEEIERAEGFSARARAWSWSSLAISLLCLGILAARPVRQRLVAILPTRRWWSSAALLTLVVLLVQRIVTLPLAWGSFRLRSEYGLTDMSTTHWLADMARNFIVSSIPMVLIVLVVLGCARRIGRWWSAWAGLLLAGGVLVGSFVYPVVVEPLSNNFAPLRQGELRDEIERLATLEGISVEDILVVDASRRTTTLNAWVSGIGPTRRVVLYDTLVSEVPQEQILAIVAHELAHARHSDVVTGTMLGASGVFVAVAGLALLFPRRRLSPQGVPVLLLLIAVGAQASAPIQNGISRSLERRADAVALEMTQDPDAIVEVQKSLARHSLSDPTPPCWSHWWWGSHPTSLERMVTVSAF